jgi:murein DD-endopeptidase MepM/ murein hydrolase activator NlpD
VHLSKEHAGLPAGTTVFVAVAHVASVVSQRTTRPPFEKNSQEAGGGRARLGRATAKPGNAQRSKHKRAHHRRKRRGDEPLKVTPPLGFSASHYVFPVTGESSYVDTYGAYRGDVPGNWHHGDDIFAALGTPVVAVADGTLNRVGWERLGGWRLWVRDQKRNEFYYAHLSGYSPLAMRAEYVKAGDVIGFIGNTGDAFATSPHLHFEIHPHQLLGLDYNGAVDPTGYLDDWRHVKRLRAPLPVHPRSRWARCGPRRATCGVNCLRLAGWPLMRRRRRNGRTSRCRARTTWRRAVGMLPSPRFAAAARPGSVSSTGCWGSVCLRCCSASRCSCACGANGCESQVESATRSSSTWGLAGGPLRRNMRTSFLPARNAVSAASSEKRSLPPVP